MSAKSEALKLIKKIEAKADWIDRSMDALQELIKAKEIEFARAFLELFMDKLDTQDNVLLTTENNKRLLASIDRIFATLKSGISTQIITKMVKDVNHIISENSEFYGRMSNMSNKEFNLKSKTIKDIVYDRLGLDEDGALKKEGYMQGLLDTSEVRNKIKDYSYRGVLTKSGFESFKNGAKDLIAGEPGKLGAFSKYHRNYAFDIYSEVDAMNSKMFKDQLGLKYFIYNGGIIKNSRSFCIRKAGRVFTVDETESWADESDNTAQQPNYDPLINRGGYGCRHSIDYINETMAFMLRPDLKYKAEFQEKYKSKSGSVDVHPKKDIKDYADNLKAAKVLADSGYNVKIMPHENNPNKKNPEFSINGLPGDLKTPKKGSKAGIDNALKSAHKQGAQSVVIDLSNTGYSVHFVKTEIARVFANNRKKSIREVILVNGTKAATINRVEILNNWDWVGKIPL